MIPRLRFPSELDKAWAAGFFDGEGSIMWHQYPGCKDRKLRLTIGQNKIEPLLWLKERWDGSIDVQVKGRKNTYYRLVLSFNKARLFLEDVKPYLKVKVWDGSKAL